MLYLNMKHEERIDQRLANDRDRGRPGLHSRNDIERDVTIEMIGEEIAKLDGCALDEAFRDRIKDILETMMSVLT